MPRNLEATIDIAAPPEQVWAVVADLRRMPEFSPQCIRMFVIGGEIGVGARTINLNRDGWKRWPTSSKVVRYEPNKAIAFRVVENHVTWSYELTATETGTTLTERRDVSEGVTTFSRKAIAVGLGGEGPFETKLEQGMSTTLSRIKAAVEGAAVAGNGAV